MLLEDQKAMLRKISVFGGLIEIFSIGVINSVYSDGRWPTSSGIQLLIDFVYVSFSNPYALLSGVLVYLTFNRWAEKAEDMRAGKNDLVVFLLIAILAIWTIVLMKGIIVY